MEITIRTATEADFDAVRSNTVRAYTDAGFVDDEYAYTYILASIEAKSNYAALWVAEADGAVVGSVFVTQAGGDYSDVAHDGELEFRMLAVEPKAQGQGIGHKLVESVVDHARRSPGISAVVLTTGPGMVRTHAMYESFGFHRVPERDLQLSEDFSLFTYKLQL